MCPGEGSSCARSCGEMGPSVRGYMATRKGVTGYCTNPDNNKGDQNGGGGGAEAGGASTDITSTSPFDVNRNPYDIAMDLMAQKRCSGLSANAFL